MNSIKRVSVKQLAYKMRGYGNHPRFAVFLGAGASRQSGIITAGEMIRFFKERIVSECSTNELETDEQKEKWLKEQEWYKKEGAEYCTLFEYYEPKEIGRQRYIESIVEGHEPSYGYVVLANLIASKLINTIITTNFDDLVYSACTSYTGIRPIVYAYGVLASEMRITAQRPKILKLHGDYLYSTLKNTDSEIALQDPNMARQVAQVLNEYGLAVIGYSGGDKSVIDILEQTSEKNDLYWCVMRNEEPNDAVKNLLRHKGGFLVEIDGFDEMMNEVRQIVGFDVGKMFGSLQERQDQMIENLKTFAPRYSIDILSEVVEALQNQAKQANREQDQIKRIQSLDFFTKAFKASEQGESDVAEKLYRKVIELDPTDAAAYYNLGNLLDKDHTGSPEAEAAYRKAIELNPKLTQPYNNLILMLRLQGRDEEVIPIADIWLQNAPNSKSALLNLAAAHKKLGNEIESGQYAANARKTVKSDDWYDLACLESICENVDAAIENLRLAIEAGTHKPEWVKKDPDLLWIRNDPRFKSLVGKADV